MALESLGWVVFRDSLPWTEAASGEQPVSGLSTLCYQMFNVGGKGELPWGRDGREEWLLWLFCVVDPSCDVMLLSLKDFVRGLMCQVVCFGDHKQHSIYFLK